MSSEPPTIREPDQDVDFGGMDGDSLLRQPKFQESLKFLEDVKVGCIQLLTISSSNTGDRSGSRQRSQMFTRRSSKRLVNSTKPLRRPRKKPTGTLRRSMPKSQFYFTDIGICWTHLRAHFRPNIFTKGLDLRVRCKGGLFSWV